MIAAIIVEYNPLHNGHIYHIEQTKKILNKLAPNEENNIIAIMSGNFTERGDIAVFNKFTRAKHAILAGVDMVLELPTIYATSSAEYFARGAISLASKIKNLRLITFGAECDEISTLSEIAKITVSADYELLLKQNLKNGLSYTVASENAIKNLSKIDTNVVFSPNNMLGMEYIKQAKQIGLNVQFIPIKRLGNGYNDNNLTGDFNSAKAIRNAINKENLDFESLKVPKFVFEDLQKIKIHYDKLFAVVANNCLETDNVYEDTEGIINRIKKYSQTAKSYQELVDLVHTKRYTKSKIKRILLHIALKHKPQDLYAIGKPNVLAVNENKKNLLSSIDFSGDEHCITQNIYANKIYNILSEDKIISNNMIIVNSKN